MRRENARPRRGPPRPAAESTGVGLAASGKPVEGGPGPVLRPLYDGKVGLSLLAGPAHAGKVALLLERYLARLDDEPVLIVPNRSDVDRVERDLLGRCGCLLGGTIGTFDDLFARLAAGDPGWRRVAGEAERSLVVRRALAGVSLDGLAGSARTAGFSDSLLRTLGELESGLLDPTDVDGELAVLYAAYRGELERLGLWDRDTERRRAVERLQNEFASWSGEPVFAYGFEDLTGAEWTLLEALSGRAEVFVSLPYEPGGLRSPRWRARRTTCPRSPTARSRSSRRVLPSLRIRRWPISSERCSRSLHPRRSSSTARFASSRARALAGRWSSLATSCSS